MKRKNWLVTAIVGFAVVAAVAPSAIKASSPNTIGYFDVSDCTHSRNCSNGTKFCGYTNADCTGLILKMP